MPDRLFANIVEGDGEHLMNTDLLVAADIKTNLTEEQSLVVKDVIGRRLLKVKKQQVVTRIYAF